MEIILKQDIEGLGFKDDLVIVKNGYGRNFLIPTGKAMLATLSAKKVLAEDLKQKAFKEQKLVEDSKKLANKISKLEFKIPAKVGTADKLFGSVSNHDISKVLETSGYNIEKKFISVSGGNIKRLGKYVAKIRLHREIIFDLNFEIVPEKK